MVWFAWFAVPLGGNRKSDICGTTKTRRGVTVGRNKGDRLVTGDENGVGHILGTSSIFDWTQKILFVFNFFFYFFFSL